MPKATKKAAPRAAKPGTVKAVAYAAILKGKSTEDVLKAVREAFPGAKTSKSCVAYYRHRMRQEGLEVPAPKTVPPKDRDA